MRNRSGNPSLVDFVKGRLTPDESLKVIEQIEVDPSLSKQVDVINDLVNLAEMHGPLLSQIEGGATEKTKWFRFPETVGRRIAYCTAVLAVCSFLAIGFIAFRWGMPSRYAALVELGKVDLESEMRGAAGEDFELAHRWCDEGRIDDAIGILERFTRAYPKGDAVDYAHLSVGSLYLVSARGDMLWVIRTFDRARVNKAITHLEIAADGSHRVRVIEESRIRLAKAYLILGNLDRAKTELGRVVSLSGLREQEARDLLTGITAQ